MIFNSSGTFFFILLSHFESSWQICSDTSRAVSSPSFNFISYKLYIIKDVDIPGEGCAANFVVMFFICKTKFSRSFILIWYTESYLELNTKKPKKFGFVVGEKLLFISYARASIALWNYPKITKTYPLLFILHAFHVFQKHALILLILDNI